MKEFNFNTIKNLPVPEQWIENALAIPETEEQKPAVVPLSNVHCEESAEPMTRQSQPFWRKPRFIALAASMVLVTALSISLFLSMGSKPPIAVKSDSKPDSTQIVWSTDEYGATVATEVVSVPDDGNQNGAHPSEKPSASSQSVENALGGGDRTSPTALSGQGGSESASPTTPGDQRGSATRHGGTSQSPTAAPQKPTASTSPVTPDPTAAPTPIETASHETEVAPPVELPTTAPWERPPDEPTEPPVYHATITSSIFKPTYGLGEKDTIPVYCKILSTDKSVLYGDPDLYSEQHRAIITENNPGTLKFAYTPADLGILPADGKYYCEFYDENGRRLRYVTMYLSK